VGYYGIWQSGAKVLTITDPVPRVIPHIGDDGIVNLQVLPPIEAPTGEMHIDKTNDIVDAIVGNINSFTVGEVHFEGVITNQRGFENQVGALAYSAAQDSDPDSLTFGKLTWDFRIFPKAVVFQRETGYTQEANERLYSFTPMYTVAHLWGTAFSQLVEGFTRAQVIRGISEFKPNLVSYLGDGTTKAFPFDSARPAKTANKVIIWKNGVLMSTGFTAYTYGVIFTSAPALNDVVIVFYES
jgi:hypothetical protein